MMEIDRTNGDGQPIDPEVSGWDKIREDMDNKKYLGALILKGRLSKKRIPWHYTAVSSTVHDCWKFNEDDNVSNRDRELTYMDSLGTQWVCRTKDEMIPFLQEYGDVNSLISIFATDDSVDCPAVRIVKEPDRWRWVKSKQFSRCKDGSRLQLESRT